MTGQYHRRPSEVLALKAWLYDEGIPLSRLEQAWAAALAAPNRIIVAFAESGMEVIDLPKHLVKDLLTRYPESTAPNEQRFQVHRVMYGENWTLYTTPIGMLYESEAEAERLRDSYIEMEGPGFDFRVVTLTFPGELR